MHKEEEKEEKKNPGCGSMELILFSGALVAGTGCSLTSKILLSMKSHGMTGEVENFSYPLFQTFGMFIGMTAALGMHELVRYFRIPFPGYVHKRDDGKYIAMDGTEVNQPKEVPSWMYYILSIPSVFDLVATTLCMYGLRYVNVSIYQMLRGSAIVFVALLKQFVLKDRLKSFMWVGIFWNVISILLVGLTVMLSSEDSMVAGQGNPLIGVFLILGGALVQSLQYAFEEKVMTGTGDEMASTPPLLLIGMEGLWGSLICVFILYPIAYLTPGPDHGCFENPFNTMAMLYNSSSVQFMFVLYFIAVFAYNILAVLVTFTLNSVWHAILDNFRPITVWGTDMFIFYSITKSFGEPWSTYSWVQLLGMFVLLYGTAIYNAPNPGSIKLTGGFYNCFLDFSKEYDYDELDDDDSVVGAPLKNKEAFYQMSPFLTSPAINAAAAEPQSPFRSMPYRGGLEAPTSAGPIRSTVGGSASKASQYGGGNWTPPRPTNLASSLEMGGRGPLSASAVSSSYGGIASRDSNSIPSGANNNGNRRQ